MLALHEIIRDIGRSLATLSGDDFAEGLTKALADLLPAFHVGIAEICDRLGARTSAVIVVATSPPKNGETLADATAVAAHACPALDETSLHAGYATIARVKGLEKTPSADVSRSTVTLGVIVAMTSSQSLESIAETMRQLNGETSADLRPDMVVVLTRGTINYLVTFGADQTMPGDWLPPARGRRDVISPCLLHMVTTATIAFSLNRLVGFILGQLAFYAPSFERPDMKAAIVGVPSNRTVIILYQFDLGGKLVELHKIEPVATPPYLIESPARELLAKMFYQPWQDGAIVILDGLLPLEGLLPFAPLTAPFMTIKLKNDRQISSVLPLTLDDFKKFAEEIAKRSNLMVRLQPQEFTVAHLADEGSSTPFVARLWMTPLHLRDLILHQAADIEAFNATYHSILSDLSTLRRIGRETLDLWKAHVERVARGEIVRYDNGIHVDQTIDEPLFHNVETIIRNGANAAKQVQELTRLFGTDIGFMFKDDKGFEAGIKAVEAADPMLADYLRETRKWSQPLTLTRNNLEHQSYVAPRIQYVRKAGDRFEVSEPNAIGLPLSAFIPVILSRLNRFIEEVLTRSMQTAITKPMVIAEIPIGARDAAKPERFIAGLLGQVQPWQIIYSDDAFDDV